MISKENRNKLKSFARTVKRANISKDFALIFAECDSPAEQEIYVEELRQMCGQDGVVLTEVKLLEKPWEKRLLPVIKEHLEKTFKDGKPERLGIQVTGLELSILLDDDEQTPAVLQILNMNRESYYNELPFPFIFWLPEYAIVKVANAAPDFWSFRVNSATFCVDGTPPSLLPESIESGKSLTVWQDKLAQIPLLERLVNTQSLPGVRVNLLIKSGDAYYYLGKTDKAKQRYELAIEENKKAKGKPQRVAEAYNKLGLIYSDLGTDKENLEKAEKSLQQYLDIVKQGNRTDLAAIGYNHLGLVYDRHNKFQQALQAYQEAQDISRRHGHRKLEGDVLGNMGLLFRNQKEYQDALDMHEQALIISRETDDIQGEALDLSNIGVIYHKEDQHEKAIDYYNQALLKNRHLGNKLEELNQLIYLGNAWKALGNFSKALESYQSARAIAQVINIKIFTVLDCLIELFGPDAIEDVNQEILLLKEAIERSAQLKKTIEKKSQLEVLEKNRQLEQSAGRELHYWQKLIDIYRKRNEIIEKNNCLMKMEALINKQIIYSKDKIECLEKLSKILKELDKKKELKDCLQKLEELKQRQIIAWFEPETVQLEKMTPVVQVGKTYKLNMQIVQKLPKHPLIYQGKIPFFKAQRRLSNIEEQWVIEGRRTSSMEKAAAKIPKKEKGDVSQKEIVLPKDNKGVKPISSPGKKELEIPTGKRGKASKIQAPQPSPFNSDSFGTTISFHFKSPGINFEPSKIDILLSESNISDVGIITITPQTTGEDRIFVKFRNEQFKYKNDFDIPLRIILGDRQKIISDHWKQKPVIFLAFANDQVDSARYLRNLAKEQREIRKALEKAKQSGLCEIVVRSNADVDDILDVFQDEMYRDRIVIFHYGGHADCYKLLLESITGARSFAFKEGLASFLGRQKGLKLVFLNGSSTEQHAFELIKAGIPAVIGTSQDINDQVATQLAIRFYNGIANGIVLERAWWEAEDDIKILKGSSNFNSMYHYSQQEKHQDRFPLDIFFKEGAENVKEWKLLEGTNLIRQIFISYSHKDKKFANRLTIDLENAGLGLSVWVDEKEIKVGESISKKIDEGISGCDFFCLVISRNSVNSKWVEREYRTALNAQLAHGTTPKIIPLIIQDVERPLHLKDIKSADFSKDYNSGFMQLLNAIKKGLGPSHVAVTQPGGDLPLIESRDKIYPKVQHEEKSQKENDVKEAVGITSGIMEQYKVLSFGVNQVPVKYFPKMAYTENDAATVSEFFGALKDKADVTLFNGNYATKKNIINWIKECNLIPKELNVIIYFAGHSSAEINEDKKSLERCLWVDSNEHQDLEKHKLKTSEILKLLDNPYHRLIFIIDACYSLDARYRDINIQEIFKQFKDSERVTSLKSYVIISAAALNQYALEDPQLGHGVLTYHFLQTISGKYTSPLQKKISFFKFLEILDKKVRTHRFTTDTGRKRTNPMLVENGIMINSNSGNFYLPILKPSRFSITKKS